MAFVEVIDEIFASLRSLKILTCILFCFGESRLVVAFCRYFYGWAMVLGVNVPICN